MKSEPIPPQAYGSEVGAFDAVEPPSPNGSGAVGALALQIWLSPSFPVGSFAFSHGIEWAAQSGDVIDVATAADWIGTLLEYGSLRHDVIIASCAWQAATAKDFRELQSLAELALAMAGSRERLMETTAQGMAFVAAVRSAWATPAIDALFDSLTAEVAYPIAVGAAAAGQEIAQRMTLEMFAVALVQNLVSATIRLSVLGHSDGQRVLASLLPAARHLAASACHATLDDLGGCAFRSDIASMKHETQYTRLFRS